VLRLPFECTLAMMRERTSFETLSTGAAR
jgi:hypothetical protein